MKTLVVDDNKTTRKLLKAVLESSTNGIVLAKDGQEAMRKLEQVEIDLIVSDVQMPNMDGFTMIFRIRNNDRLKHIPVILYSAIYTDTTFEKMALDCGARKFVRKNGSAGEIQAAVSEFIADRAA